jgi:hypothetical protein
MAAIFRVSAMASPREYGDGITNDASALLRAPSRRTSTAANDAYSQIFIAI